MVSGEEGEERLDRPSQHRGEVMVIHVLFDETRQSGELVDRGRPANQTSTRWRARRRSSSTSPTASRLP